MKRLDDIKARVARAQYEIPRLVQPERSFVQDTADLDLLVSALEVALEALRDAQDTICAEFCGYGHHNVCERPVAALAKITRLLDGEK